MFKAIRFFVSVLHEIPWKFIYLLFFLRGDVRAPRALTLFFLQATKKYHRKIVVNVFCIN